MHVACFRCSLDVGAVVVVLFFGLLFLNRVYVVRARIATFACRSSSSNDPLKDFQDSRGITLKNCVKMEHV